MINIGVDMDFSEATLDHVGIAVRQIAETLKAYRLLGIEPGQREVVADQGVELQMLPVGITRLELLQPMNDDSPLSKFIQKRGEGLHHIALKVQNIEAVLESCKNNGIRLIDEKPRIGAGGSLIAFIHPASTGGVLIELVENP
jgi:methylmalonyl-CoA/ethylmalonyl-CoA epimerase